MGISLHDGLIMFAIFVVLGGLAFYAIHGVWKSGRIFFDLANELEDDIRKNHDYDGQRIKLIELHNKSFHKDTGARLRELAKMMEIKYDIRILKR